MYVYLYLYIYIYIYNNCKNIHSKINNGKSNRGTVIVAKRFFLLAKTIVVNVIVIYIPQIRCGTFVMVSNMDKNKNVFNCVIKISTEELGLLETLFGMSRKASCTFRSRLCQFVDLTILVTLM